MVINEIRFSINFGQKKHDKVQYKFWAEALDVKKHDSKEYPPDDPIWGSKKVTGGVSEMTSAFTHILGEHCLQLIHRER